jgi:hypothetical protein
VTTTGPRGFPRTCRASRPGHARGHAACAITAAFRPAGSILPHPVALRGVASTPQGPSSLVAPVLLQMFLLAVRTLRRVSSVGNG